MMSLVCLAPLRAHCRGSWADTVFLWVSPFQETQWAWHIKGHPLGAQEAQLLIILSPQGTAAPVFPFPSPDLLSAVFTVTLQKRPFCDRSELVLRTLHCLSCPELPSAHSPVSGYCCLIEHHCHDGCVWTKPLPLRLSSRGAQPLLPDWRHQDLACLTRLLATDSDCGHFSFFQIGLKSSEVSLLR